MLRVENAADGTKIFEYDLKGNKTLESTWFDDDTPRDDITFVYGDAGRLEGVSVEGLMPRGRISL